MEWIKPTNPVYYNHWKAFEKLNELYWKDRSNFEIGDIVYLYSSLPDARITHKCIVVECNVDKAKAQTINDDAYLTEKGKKLNTGKTEKYHRLKILKVIYSNELGIEKLKKQGLSKSPQNSQRLSLELSDYINDIFNNDNLFPNEIADTRPIYSEGAVQQVLVNKYERNPKARLECINYYGSYKCQICNFDFAQVYGEIGKEFIHVHHIIPLNEIGNEYIVNPINDLIPVCPNCHAMLHRKYNGTELSFEELQKNMKNKLM